MIERMHWTVELSLIAITTLDMESSQRAIHISSMIIMFKYEMSIVIPRPPTMMSLGDRL